jgi:hypothetical protein
LGYLWTIALDSVNCLWRWYLLFKKSRFPLWTKGQSVVSRTAAWTIPCGNAVGTLYGILQYPHHH